MDRVDFYETHIFKYSKRAGTKAAVMEHQIPEQVKTIRSNELLALDKEKRTKFEAQFLGKTVEVLMEESVEMNGKTYQVGHTKEYMKILLEENTDLQNQFVKVQLQENGAILR